MYACKEAHLPVVQYLIQQGAQVNQKDNVRNHHNYNDSTMF